MKTITAILLSFVMAGCMITTHRGPAIRDRLSATHGLATHNISIDEESPGFVTLNGNVSSIKDRERIEEVARDTRGVRQVRSNLIVDPSSVAVREGYTSSSNDDMAIASEIASRMSASPELRNYSLNVEVIDRAVTLRGEVSNESERDSAGYIARDTRGVTSVKNEIFPARSATSDFQISQNVGEALRRTTSNDLRNIDISTRDAVVTLRGRQDSNREIDNLVYSARRVPGVRDVRNEITLNDRRYSDRYLDR